LKNDSVVQGNLQFSGDVCHVTGPFGETGLKQEQVAFIGHTLLEVYQFRKNRTPKNSEAFVDLANWCLQNGLDNEAAGEFDCAVLWAKSQEEADAVRRQKAAVMPLIAQKQAATGMMRSVTQDDPESGRLREWGRRIPASTFRQFQKEVLPVLSRNCSGVACHGGDSLNKFRLAQNGHETDLEADLFVIRNLQAVLPYLNADSPLDSPLIRVPILPHGQTKQIFTQRNLKQYKKLYDWSLGTAKEMKTYFPPETGQQATQTNSDIIPFNPETKMRAIENAQYQRDQAGGIEDASSNQLAAYHETGKNAPPNATSANVQKSMPANPVPFDFFSNPQLDFSGMASRNGEIQGTNASSVQTPPILPSAPPSWNPGQPTQKQSVSVDPFDPAIFNSRYHSGK